MPNNDTVRVKVPHYPRYTLVRAALQAWQGISRADINSMRKTISGLMGTPQNTLTWTDPDTWVSERLIGQEQHIAKHIWEGSNKLVNPRYMVGLWLLTTGYNLIKPDLNDVMQLTEQGQAFITELEGKVVQEIDRMEGLQHLLILVGEKGPVTPGELNAAWTSFLANSSAVKSDRVIRSYLRARLKNLGERQYIEKSGNAYTITPKGQAYLALTGYSTTNSDKDLMALINKQKDDVRIQIKDQIANMNPFAFEHLIKDLLEAMNYQDVEVTSPSGDGGVDVIGNIELGITAVKEVIQVKRHQKNIQRSVLDALRGSLHRFQAVRGTIITTSDFARGTKDAAFEPGVAPITLIDGEKLVDLLIENNIGIQKREVELWSLDPSAFQNDEPETL